MNNFVIIYEAQADATIGSDLADRVFQDQIQWLENESNLLDQQRNWITAYSGAPLRWDKVNTWREKSDF